MNSFFIIFNIPHVTWHVESAHQPRLESALGWIFDRLSLRKSQSTSFMEEAEAPSQNDVVWIWQSALLHSIESKCYAESAKQWAQPRSWSLWLLQDWVSQSEDLSDPFGHDEASALQSQRYPQQHYSAGDSRNNANQQIMGGMGWKSAVRVCCARLHNAASRIMRHPEWKNRLLNAAP